MRGNNSDVDTGMSYLEKSNKFLLWEKEPIIPFDLENLPCCRNSDSNCKSPAFLCRRQLGGAACVLAFTGGAPGIYIRLYSSQGNKQIYDMLWGRGLAGCRNKRQKGTLSLTPPEYRQG